MATIAMAVIKLPNMIIIITVSLMLLPFGGMSPPAEADADSPTEPQLYIL
jgi:hypothetical protein